MQSYFQISSLLCFYTCATLTCHRDYELIFVSVFSSEFLMAFIAAGAVHALDRIFCIEAVGRMNMGCEAVHLLLEYDCIEENQ